MTSPLPPASAPPIVEADLEPSTTAPAKSPVARIMLAIGSAGLLAAMSTDALAVAGRHAGVRLLGSIEIVQACIVVVATSAIVLTTLVDAHARVHILLERLSSSRSTTLLRAADLLSALVFLWLAGGSIWLSSDLWSSAELTEILQLQLRWLRLAWIVGALAAAALFVRRAAGRIAG